MTQPDNFLLFVCQLFYRIIFAFSYSFEKYSFIYTVIKKNMEKFETDVAHNLTCVFRFHHSREFCLNPNSISVNAKVGKSNCSSKDLIIRKRAVFCYRSSLFSQNVRH